MRAIEANEIWAAVQSGAPSTARTREQIMAKVVQEVPVGAGVVRKAHNLSTLIQRKRREELGYEGNIPQTAQEVYNLLPDNLR